MSNSLWPHEPQHARLPCPSPTPRAYSNSCPSSWWCHPTISSSVVPFSSLLQSFPVSGSFQISQFSISGGQSIWISASASVLPMNIQNWFPLGWFSFSIRDSQASSPIPQFKSVRYREGEREGLSDTHWTVGLDAALLPNNQLISTWVNSVHEEQQHLMPSTSVLNVEENGCF